MNNPDIKTALEGLLVNAQSEICPKCGKEFLELEGTVESDCATQEKRTVLCVGSDCEFSFVETWNLVSIECEVDGEKLKVDKK